MANTKTNKTPLSEEIVEENEELKRKIAELQAQLENKGKEEESSVGEVETNESYESELKSEDYINVISLCPFTLTLSTLGFGKGKVFNFKKFGEVKRILYGDLVSIMETNYGFLESGYFYILDKRVVRKHGLDYAYEQILSKSQIEEFFSEDANLESCVQIYEQANSRQRRIIERMVIGRLATDEPINRNLVASIGQISNIDLFASGKELKEKGIPL